ncbi:hypothetical protein niasHT_026254 [Heterodera trifolii]|uniref:Homeobox domain-containing protein n=1 Tax=Heterodera trifolii TaxID=157864 RepID=A0ABD2JCH5_9BILA
MYYSHEQLEESDGQTRKMYWTIFSQDQLDKLERAFRINKFLTNDDQLTQLVNETELTEAQINLWFQHRLHKLRRLKYLHLQEQQLRKNVAKTVPVLPKAAVEIEQNSQQNTQQQNFSADELDKLERKFGITIIPSASDRTQLAMETGLTEKQVEEWFYIWQALQKILRQKRNTTVADAKVCVECGQQIVHQLVPQSQPNTIGTVCAVRGRAKCRCLFWRAVIFPMNAIAKFVKKVCSAKSALANKVKNEKK